MGHLSNGVARRLKTCIKIMSVASIALSLSTATAQDRVSLRLTPLEIRNDRGGLLTVRLEQLETLKRSQQPVRISGRICYSTCTMFLGLPQTCISPDTTFGFHGPSSYGRSLDQQTFDRASRAIASYYPAPLRDWYMTKGRYELSGFYRIKGANLIALGVRAC